MPNVRHTQSHQDWDPQTFTPASAMRPTASHSSSDINRARQIGQSVTVATRTDMSNQHNKAEYRHVQKIENDDDSYIHPKVDRSVAVNLRRARALKEMTQQQLAMAINEKAAVIQSYENGSAIPSGKLIVAMERALGVRIHGQHALEPLPARGSKGKA
ncbi:MBF1-domain-containing protein [Perkinsela sp. CCAP 1560/4]|nr:MBF1-domain-containing protein [Perkinsela sp. CCAP 1560/4]|eukprot:KNH06819.1 MBF1-domain-containing protein [Perkinsela sp. CCAP 1560/4]